MNKAYKIVTSQHSPGEYEIYSADNAGHAKTMCVSGLQECFYAATYSWIKSCKRSYEYDKLAEKYNGCLAWRFEDSYWIVEGEMLD